VKIVVKDITAVLRDERVPAGRAPFVDIIYPIAALLSASLLATN
jgi:hypothetical protein